MRTSFFSATVILCLTGAALSAQSGLRSASLPDRTPSAPMPPARADEFLAGPDTYKTKPDRQPGQGPFVPSFGFFGNTYVPDPWPPASAYRGALVQPAGYLQIDVQPRTAHVYVDGMYMGSADDFARVIPGRALEPGPHRVEMRAPGHDPLTFDVRIFPRETVTYRNALQVFQTAQAPAVAAPRAIPKTFYVIPGCYAGDKPPQPGTLRRGCDASKLRTIPPTMNAVRR